MFVIRISIGFVLGALLMLPEHSQVMISGGQDDVVPPVWIVPEPPPEDDCNVAINGFASCSGTAQVSSCNAFSGACSFVAGTGFIHTGLVVCGNQNEIGAGGVLTGNMCGGTSVLLYSNHCNHPNGGGDAGEVEIEWEPVR